MGKRSRFGTFSREREREREREFLTFDCVKPRLINRLILLDGYVGLWDLNTTSSLLLDETNSIFPYKYFRVHLRNNPTFVDLSTESDPDGFPLHLITGSTDRMFTTWDLGSSDDFPIRDYRRMFITDVLWLSHYAANASVSHDDSCLQSNTRFVGF